MAKAHRIIQLVFLLWGAFALGYTGYILYVQHVVPAILCIILSGGVLWGFVRQLRRPDLPHPPKKIPAATLCAYLLLTGLFVYMLLNGLFNAIGLVFAIAILLHIAASIVGTRIKS